MRKRTVGYMLLAETPYGDSYQHIANIASAQSDQSSLSA